jgi:hypothetical protein
LGKQETYWRASPAEEVQEMVMVAMFNFVLLLLNFFIGLRTENKAAATPSTLPPGEAGSETEELVGTAVAASEAR